MSIYFTTAQLLPGRLEVRYAPARGFTYGKHDQFDGHADAKVWVHVGPHSDASLVLDPEDARTLITGLQAAVAAHELATESFYRVDLVKAAA
ncbi:hypothetical protein [Nocardia xishanensis]